MPPSLYTTIAVMLKENDQNGTCTEARYCQEIILLCAYLSHLIVLSENQSAYEVEKVWWEARSMDKELVGMLVSLFEYFLLEDC